MTDPRDYSPLPTTTGEMKALGVNVDLRDAIARWAADPDDPIDPDTWRGYAPAYRALLRQQADKLFGLTEVRDLIDLAVRMDRVKGVIAHLADPETQISRRDTVRLLALAVG